MEVQMKSYDEGVNCSDIVGDYLLPLISALLLPGIM